MNNDVGCLDTQRIDQSVDIIYTNKMLNLKFRVRVYVEEIIP